MIENNPTGVSGPSSGGPPVRLARANVAALAWTTDSQLRLTMFSATGFSATGFSPLSTPLSEATGTPAAEFFHLNGLPFPPLGALHRALVGEVSTYEQKWAGRTLQLHVGPRLDEQNQIVGCAGFGHDVTDRELAERALRESEGRYRAISELTSTYAYSTLLAPGGSLFPEWVTGDFVQITGYSFDEIKRLGGPFMLIHPADREVAVKRTECLLAGDPHVSEFRIITKSGETRWLRDYGRPIRDDVQDRTVRIFGAAQDITARKQSEEALRRSEERFRLVFEEGPLGMATLTPDGTLLQVNRALVQMAGYSPEEMTGKRFVEFVHPDDAPTSNVVLNQLAEGALKRHTWEGRCVAAKGRIVWARVTATVLHDHDGRMLCILTMIEDVTERKRTEEALRRAERLASIGTLAAGIAHEINNPLGAITLSVDAVTMAEEQSNREDILEAALENIRASALRCGRIVKSVLQFARDEVSEKSLADLVDVVHRARDMARSFARNQDILLDLEIEEGLPSIVMNTTEIGQVVVSLLSNAVHASPPGSHVILRVERVDETAVRIVVEDPGCGMTAEQLGRVFDPFYTSRPERGGIGLGLSITYGIVRHHGGTIDIQSKPGEGTKVYVTLPVREQDPVAAALAAGSAAPPTPRPPDNSDETTEIGGA